MLIDHPLLGPRDAQEFTYFGSAEAMQRPDPAADGAQAAFVDWLYLRDNVAGEHEELWFHEYGDRSWLVVTRNTLSHTISSVRLASDVARERGRSR